MSNYIIVRDGELYHHGIKGQKWGIRRFENADGSLTEEGKKRYNKSLDKAFKRESRKLGRYEKRADVDLQERNYEKYSKQARTLGKAAGITGALSGAAAFDSAKTIPYLLSKKTSALDRKHTTSSGSSYEDLKKSASDSLNAVVDRYNFSNSEAARIGGLAYKASRNAALYRDVDGFKAKLYEREAKRLRKQANGYAEDASKYYDTARSWSNDIARYDSKIKTRDAEYADVQNKASNAMNTTRIASYVLGGTAIALGVTAGTRAIQSAVAKKRTTTLGHDKAVQRYEAHVNDMLKQFGGTKYESIIKERVRAYRDEHPNTQLNDSKIEKMLNGK